MFKKLLAIAFTLTATSALAEDKWVTSIQCNVGSTNLTELAEDGFNEYRGYNNTPHPDERIQIAITETDNSSQIYLNRGFIQYPKDLENNPGYITSSHGFGEYSLIKHDGDTYRSYEINGLVSKTTVSIFDTKHGALAKVTQMTVNAFGHTVMEYRLNNCTEWTPSK